MNSDDIKAIEQKIEELQAQVKERGYSTSTLARIVRLKQELIVLHNHERQALLEEANKHE